MVEDLGLELDWHFLKPYRSVKLCNTSGLIDAESKSWNEPAKIARTDLHYAAQY